MTENPLHYRAPSVRPQGRPYDPTMGDALLIPAMFYSNRDAQFASVMRVARKRAGNRGKRQHASVRKSLMLGGFPYWIVQDY